MSGAGELRTWKTDASGEELCVSVVIAERNGIEHHLMLHSDRNGWMGLNGRTFCWIVANGQLGERLA